MTMPAGSIKHVYDGNATTRDWDFTFPIISLDGSDIKLYKTAIDGTVTEITSNYSVDVAGSFVTYPTIVSGLALLAVGEKITLVRTEALSQAADWKNKGPFNSETVEAALDKLTAIIQQQDEELSRAIKYAVDQTPTTDDTEAFIAILTALKVATETARDIAVAARNTANADVVLTHADVALTNADVVLTALDRIATAADRVQTALDVISTAADAVQTALDVISTGADVTQTGLDAIATAADRVQTALDVIATAADAVQTGLDAIATGADAIQTAADRVQTGLDAVDTGADAIATAADRVQTGLDAIATAADRVQTGLDVIQTAADRVQTALDVIATGADRVQTGLDAAATAQDAIDTAADRVQTGLDVIAAAAQAAALLANSTTSNAIGIGAKTFTIEAGKQFATGQFILIVDGDNSANYMHGQVTSYSGTSLVVDVQSIGGSGTKTHWHIFVSGAQGTPGATASYATTAEIITGTEAAKVIAPNTLKSAINVHGDWGWWGVKTNRLIMPHAGDNTRVCVNPDALTIPIIIGDHSHIMTAVVDVDEVDDLDTGTLAAGTDYCIYACTDGTTLSFKVSANATVPSGFDAAHSRKIGGFHTLCVAVGTISGHSLTDFAVKDILPASIWDLHHRPVCSPNGMVYSTGINKWVDIYLASGTGASTASVYGGTISDTRNWMDFADDGGAVKKKMLDDAEFQIIAAGSNEETNINGSGDPGTTGGHVDTASRRMISNIGVEDACGALNQWLSTQSYFWRGETGYWGNLPGGKGSYYGNYASDPGAPELTSVAGGDVKLIAGGSWDYAAYAGSRFRDAAYYRWVAGAGIGCRFCAEPV